MACAVATRRPPTSEEVTLNFRSILAGGSHSSDQLVKSEYPAVVSRYPVKFWWFAKHGYQPHVYQALFHGAADEERQLTQFRHLVAGRRGGKTLSAAWEVLFYAMNPREFHRDAHGTESDRPLWIWILAKDYPSGFPSLATLLDVMGQAKLVKGRDYQYNKTERRIEFTESGTIVQFKTADNPQSLRGAGLDILWIDEAAFIEDDEAWLVTAPALADKLGLVITTTTPHGKNWFWKEFFQGDALTDPAQFRVEYTSIDNPYFPRRSWEYYRRRYHPIMFRQEFLASFDAFTGIALQGDWLKYWTSGAPDVQNGEITIKPYFQEDSGTYKLRIFLGIDPAISQSDNADHFAMAVLGITDDNSQAFLIDYFVGRLTFPEQLDKIREWHQQWRPQMIGIESNAYQHALAQMAYRLEGLPPIVPVFSKGTKNERILAMSPVFKTGQVRIRRSMPEFIDQWVNFNPARKNQEDDLLDAVEIALGTAGVLLPRAPYAAAVEDAPKNVDDEARQMIRKLKDKQDGKQWDPELGTEF
jgi:phage terminase large subunit-like protein